MREIDGQRGNFTLVLYGEEGYTERSYYRRKV